MVSCVANLYTSVESLDAAYVRSANAKNALLSPAGGGYESTTLLQLQSSSPAAPTPVAAVEVYQCSVGGSDDCYNYVAMVKNTPCRLCRGPMNVSMELIGSSDLPASGGHGEAAEDGQGQAPAAVLAGMGFACRGS